eukprot:TRINITY_DN92104_c0_g1_i1.p1 TRINITY_DN92104_c0_g1~~TRINITY_DN92104_c0_g1_i1.p1  ORF type:complete len:380 (+),score=94.53 TRINITY_DN92104_c0_g1_i1:140-1279(+)
MARLSVLTYNVLHSFGASRLLAGRKAAAGASWPQERLLRAAELVRKRRPDVAFLQEVDEAGQSEFSRVLEEQDGEYTCAAIMRNEELPPKDGCAIFVRSSRFEVLETQQFRLRDNLGRHCDGLDVTARDRGTDMAAALWRELYEKLNLGLVARLKLREDGSSLPSTSAMPEVCVATTHLFWDPKYPDLKLLQAFLMARELEDFAKDCPVVLGGDFNSTPFTEEGGELSGVYALLLRGKLETTHPHHPVSLRPQRGILRGVKAADVPDFTLRAPCYRSAYADALGFEGPITNSSPEFEGCLDYIFYREGHRSPAGESHGPPSAGLETEAAGATTLRLLEAEPLPSEASLRGQLPLPSAEHPSDHLPLLAEFELATTSSAG